MQQALMEREGGGGGGGGGVEEFLVIKQLTLTAYKKRFVPSCFEEIRFCEVFLCEPQYNAGIVLRGIHACMQFFVAALCEEGVVGPGVGCDYNAISFATGKVSATLHC